MDYQTDMDAFVYVKQNEGTQDNSVVFFDIHKCFLSKDHVARKVTETAGKLQTPIMMVRRCCGIGTSMSPSTKKSMHSFRALQIMATVQWTMAPKSATYFKALRALS